MKKHFSMFGALAMLLLAALSVSFVACSSDEFYEQDDDLTLANRKTRSGGEAESEGEDDTSVISIFGGASTTTIYPFVDACDIRPEFAWGQFDRINKKWNDIVYRLFYYPSRRTYIDPVIGDTVWHVNSVYVVELSEPKVKWGAIHRNDANIHVKFDYYLVYQAFTSQGYRTIRYPADETKHLTCDRDFNVDIRTTWVGQ